MAFEADEEILQDFLVEAGEILEENDNRIKDPETFEMVMRAGAIVELPQESNNENIDVQPDLETGKRSRAGARKSKKDE